MGLIAGNFRCKASIEVLRCLAFYRGGHGSGYIMGLIAGNFRCKASLIVFDLLTADFFGGGTGGFHFVGAIHTLGECDFASCAAIGFTYNPFFCILADGGGLAVVHCFVFHGEGAVIIADHFSGDVIAAWYCVITQVLGDYLRPYGGTSCGIYSPFIGSDGDRAAVFIENGFCSVFHSATDFMNFGCYLAFIDIGLVESVTSQSNMVCFQSIGDFQIFSGELIIDYHIMSCNGAGSGDIYRISETAAGKGGCAVTDTRALYFTAGGYHITASGNFSGGCDGGACNGAADDGAVLGVQAGAGNSAADDGAGAGIDITTAGQDTTAIGIYAAIGCYLAVCINRKFSICPFDGAAGINFKVSIRPFDGTISIESRFCISRRIAAGKYAVRCNDGTVLAHFDALFVHGDLIITIFVQHQCIHSRGCGAVVSGDFGNHAVVAHFEVILVGRFASSFFSCHCIGILFVLRIQGG